MLHPSSQLQHTLLVVAVAACVLAAILVAEWQMLQQYLSDNEVLAGEVAVAQGQADRLSRLAQNVALIQEARTALDERFTREDEVPGILEQIEELGTSTRARVRIVGVEKITTTIPPLSGDVSVFRVNIEVAGSWTAVTKVAELLENLPRIQWVRSVRFAQEPGSGTREWTAQVSLILAEANKKS